MSEIKIFSKATPPSIAEETTYFKTFLKSILGSGLTSNSDVPTQDPIPDCSEKYPEFYVELLLSPYRGGGPRRRSAYRL